MTDPPSEPGGVDLAGLGLDAPAEEVFERVRAAERPLALGRLGEYELLGVAGSGGQGVVYRARRARTARDVALKRIPVTPDGRGGAEERFWREIEVDLALRHSNIVTVYGVEEADGQPLLAMEWIEGSSIDRWSSGRDVPSVLGAFLKVCDAVAHAHQRGVIHRDLKPSNILVDAAGEPRVLDFGLAKWSGSDPGARPRLTATGGFLGTLAYAAPEQVRGDADGADTRSDVYALGCVLHQCLTGRAPFGGGGDIEALSRAICHEGAARASSLRPGLDRDLDAIIARAMAKEKDRRYPTVEALAADLRRHAAGEPVEARRGARWYVLRRTVRRHRAAVAAAGAAALLLAGATAFSTLSWAAQSRQRAAAERVSGFMEDTLAGVSPYVALGRDTTLLREALDAAAARLEGGGLAGAPDAEARLRRAIGNTYRQVGQYERAEELLRPALALARRRLGERHEAVATLLNDLALVLADRGDGPEALALAEEALAMARRLDPGDSAGVAERLNGVGYCLLRLGRHAEALEALQKATAMHERLGATETPEALEAASNAAYCLRELGRVEEALRLDLACLEAARRVYPRGHPGAAISANNVAADLQALGRFEEALAPSQEALAVFRTLHPDDHPNLAVAMSNTAALMQYLGRFDEALPLLREATGMLGRLFPEGDAATADAMNNLGTCLLKLGRAGESVPVLDAALEMNTRLHGPEHDRVALLLHHAAEARIALSEHAEAARLAEEATSQYRRNPAWDPAERRHALEVLIAARLGQGRDADADAAVEEFVALAGPQPTPARAGALARAATILLGAGRPAAAEPLARESLTIRQSQAPGHWLTFNSMSLLGEALAGRGAALGAADPSLAAALRSEAEPLLAGGYEGLRDDPQALPDRRRQALERLAAFYIATGRPERARALRDGASPP